MVELGIDARTSGSSPATALLTERSGVAVQLVGAQSEPASPGHSGRLRPPEVDARDACRA